MKPSPRWSAPFGCIWQKSGAAMTTQKAVGYIRVSTDDQAKRGYSLPTQKAKIREYASKQGLTLTQVFQDDESGMTLHRPGLLALQQKITQDQTIKNVIIYDSDRLARRAAHYAILRDDFAETGIILHIVNQSAVISPGDHAAAMMQDIHGRVAQMEHSKIQERMHRGKREAVRNGSVMVHARPPYGYKKVVDQDGAKTAYSLEIDEEQAAVVKNIFHWYINEGLGMQAIANRLNRRGVPTWNQENDGILSTGWGTATISRMIRREAYAYGIWYYGKRDTNARLNDKSNWIPVQVPTIVDRRIFDKAQSLREKRYVNGGGNIKYNYLLHKRVTCALCGQPVHIIRRAPYVYYRCRGASVSRYPDCSASGVRKEVVEAVAWRFVVRLISDEEYLSQLINEYLGQYEDSSSSALEQIEEVDARIKAVLIKKDRLVEAYEDGILDLDTFRSRHNKHAAALSLLENERAELASHLDGNLTGQDGLVEFSRLFYEFREGVSLDPDPSFDVKRAWVEGFDITGVLDPDKETLRIACVIGEDTLSVDFHSAGTTERKVQMPLIALLPLYQR